MTDPNGAAIYGVSINIPAPWSPTHPRWGEKSPPWITTMMPCLLGDDGQQGVTNSPILRGVWSSFSGEKYGENHGKPIFLSLKLISLW